jgi:hypothetical protein
MLQIYHKQPPANPMVSRRRMEKRSTVQTLKAIDLKAMDFKIRSDHTRYRITINPSENRA